MKIIYFTDGSAISNLEIRQALIRIPEVLRAIRQLNDEIFEHDLVNCMQLPDQQFLFISQLVREKIIQTVQQALWRRLQLQGVRGQWVIDRKTFQDMQSVQLKLFHLISRHIDFSRKIEIIVIGPGIDPTLEKMIKVLRSSEVEHQIDEAIELDPQLNWFWPTVTEALAPSALNTLN